MPAHCLIIIASLLCSNQVTYRFGKGLTPKRYRLDMASMGVIMDDYAGYVYRFLQVPALGLELTYWLFTSH